MDDLISKRAVLEILSRRNAAWDGYSEVLSLPSICPYCGTMIDKKEEQAVQEVRINLNDNIKVRLTNLGKDIYYHQFDDLYKILTNIGEPTFPKEDADGYTEFQLWYFIELYGKHIGMMKPNVIEPLEIVYKIKEKNNV